MPLAKKPLFLFFSFIFISASLLGYEKNPYVDPAVWDALSPHFLPERHPVKPLLDKIFAKKRVVKSVQTVKEAGFKFVRSPTSKRIQVVKHPKLKGYLLKFYIDEQPIEGTWVDFAKRIEGAIRIEQAIRNHGYQHLFKVPKKWIYPLPSGLSHFPGMIRKNFVMVVEDMKVLKKRKNTFFWRSIALNEERMAAIYVLLQEQGLFDSVYPDNIPFCKDGKQAFVDTQHFQRWPVPFDKLILFVRPEMQIYLNQLMHPH